MPNYIKTILHVEIDWSEAANTKDQEQKLHELKQAVQTKDSKFDFNGLIPQPEGIFRGPLSEEDRIKSAGLNWYDWNVANWGTKWNAYKVSWIDGLEPDAYEFLVKFETAWSPPRPVLQAIKDKGFDVRYTYLDEGDDDWSEWIVL